MSAVVVLAYLIAVVSAYQPAIHFAFSVLSWSCAKECAGRSPKVSASYIILALWSLCQSVSMAGDQWFSAEAVIAALLFMLWECKTFFIRPAATDPLDAFHYFYGILPARGLEGACNTARPGSMAEFGGRVVIGGGYVWCVHRNHFARIPVARMDISCAALVNTGELINAETTSMLDAKVGTRAVKLLNDCSTIRTRTTLERLLFRRMISRLRKSPK